MGKVSLLPSSLLGRSSTSPRNATSTGLVSATGVQPRWPQRNTQRHGLRDLFLQDARSRARWELAPSKVPACSKKTLPWARRVQWAFQDASVRVLRRMVMKVCASFVLPLCFSLKTNGDPLVFCISYPERDRVEQT